MAWLVQARLVNEPSADPGLFIDFRFTRRALLFDLGDLAALSPRELLGVTHAFVSHMHVDHFIGFDRLLRVCLHRTVPLHLVGPEGFVDAVAGKLAGYTWNLLDETSVDFSISATEMGEAACLRRSVFRAREAFRRRDLAVPDLPPGVVLHEEAFCIETAVLDHGTPCLAFALQEKQRINVWREGLRRLGLPVGPWLNEAKSAARRGAPDDHRLTVSPGLSVPLGDVKEHALRMARGQRVVYVVDAAHTSTNAARIVALAQGADQLFIETAFLDEDAGIAAERCHLTARQAGLLARRAGATRVLPFHFSPRYAGREQALRDEVQAAFESG